jgi:threonine aldolase
VRDPQGRVDLRSDTVTRPSAAMRDAMANAEVGDDEYEEDPTVHRLQTLAAAALGMEAALFVTSGTMANQLALMALGSRGTEVLCADDAHIRSYEAAAGAVNAGVQLHPLTGPEPTFPLEAARAVLAAQRYGQTAVSVISFENTHMMGSGRPVPLAEIAAITALAAEYDVPVHVDGARLWNAAIALDVSPRELLTGVTTAMFCVSKGLGAPIGSLLCGPREIIVRARAHRHRLGGQMRQVGVIAAAGLVALETGVERLADDHARAAIIAEAFAAHFPDSVDVAAVQTNIVLADRRALPSGFIRSFEAQGVRVSVIDDHTIRIVTHVDIDDADVVYVIAALATIAGNTPGGSA